MWLYARSFVDSECVYEKIHQLHPGCISILEAGSNYTSNPESKCASDDALATCNDHAGDAGTGTG